jgi:hypothetical protein
MTRSSIDWNEGWDSEVGLWWQEGPGHSASVADLKRTHPGCNAASRLLYAAEAGCLDRLPATRVLAALRRMQHHEAGPRDGAMRWYWEEDQPHDMNAAFFTALALIPLRKLHAPQLDAEGGAHLDAILAGLQRWFAHEVGTRMFCYPNKYLGDLVCAWLLQELLGLDDSERVLETTMLEAAVCWRDDGWGWGEHMSDVYAPVCICELALLLLLAERLPGPVRDAYRGLLNQLLAIDDAFGNGPRVPAIRSYCFRECPPRTPFRARVMPVEEVAPVFNNMPILTPIFHRLGWQELSVRPEAVRQDIRVPCFDGALAVARLETDCRLGSLTRFPVMPSAEELTWGLSWQSFPVALWRPAGDWCFLQWETEEQGTVRSHPAYDQHAAYLGNALTQAVRPPLVGRTFCLQRGGRLLALRIMMPLATGWTRLTDRWRMLQPRRSIVCEKPEADRAVLRLRDPEREISVQYVDLNGVGLPVLNENTPDVVDWSVTLTEERLRQCRAVVGLWAVALDGATGTRIQRAPWRPAARRHAHSGEDAWEIRWDWGDAVWQIVVDPLAAEPLREVN